MPKFLIYLTYNLQFTENKQPIEAQNAGHALKGGNRQIPCIFL